MSDVFSVYNRITLSTDTPMSATPQLRRYSIYINKFKKVRRNHVLHTTSWWVSSFLFSFFDIDEGILCMYSHISNAIVYRMLPSKVLSLVTTKGPISVNKPYSEEAPGPPCSQMIQGVFSTDLSVTGKYQNQRLALYFLLTCPQNNPGFTNNSRHTEITLFVTIT